MMVPSVMVLKFYEYVRTKYGSWVYNYIINYYMGTIENNNDDMFLIHNNQW